MVRPVDQRHLDRRTLEKPRREQAAETRPDDHDPVRPVAHADQASIPSCRQPPSASRSAGGRRSVGAC